MLTTLLLLQAGYAYVHYNALEGVIELDKEAYYLALRQTDLAPEKNTPQLITGDACQPCLFLIAGDIMNQ